MGRKRKEKPSIELMYSKISSILVPESILKDFDIYDAQESKARWVIEMREKDDRVPSALCSFPDVVLDGYCNPVEILSHSFACKPVYLRLYRRRFTCALHEVRGKRSNKDEHFSNDYDFNLKGLKMVPELGFFFEEEDRSLSGGDSHNRTLLRHIARYPLPRTSYTVQVSLVSRLFK